MKKEFTSEKYGLKGVCLNYPDTKEELKIFSLRYQEALVNALESTFGERWAIEAQKKIQ